MAFHPRPQIASDLGPQRHPQLQPAPKSQPIPEWERNFGSWPQTQIAASLNPLRFDNRKPNPPLFTGHLSSSTLTLQPLLFWQKQGFSPKKARVFLFAEPLKSLEKEGKTHKKARKIGKQKKQGNRKKKNKEKRRVREIANPQAAIAELGPPGGRKSQNCRPQGH